jgi:hypothetical protein
MMAVDCVATRTEGVESFEVESLAMVVEVFVTCECGWGGPGGTFVRLPVLDLRLIKVMLPAVS